MDLLEGGDVTDAMDVNKVAQLQTLNSLWLVIRKVNLLLIQ